MTEPRCRPGRLWQVSGPTASAPMRGTHESWLVPVQLGPGKCCECFVKSRCSGQLRVMIFCGMVSRCFPTFGHFLCMWCTACQLTKHIWCPVGLSLCISACLCWQSFGLLVATKWYLDSPRILGFQPPINFHDQSSFKSWAKGYGREPKGHPKESILSHLHNSMKMHETYDSGCAGMFLTICTTGPKETCQTIQSPPGGRPGLF